MFQPHHRFRNCERLRKIVSDFEAAGNIPEATLTDHRKYHYALCHKLKCAQHHLEQLERVVGDQDATTLADAMHDLMFGVNMRLDSFFYSCGSAMDILAREVIVYFGIPLPNRVYFHTAREQIAANRAGDSILPRLQNPAWKREFSDYRNSLTHELIVVGKCELSLEMDGESTVAVLSIPLPDDPRQNVDQRTYSRNTNVIEYCTATFRRLLRLCNQVYGEISDRAETHGSLPI